MKRSRQTLLEALSHLGCQGHRKMVDGIGRWRTDRNSLHVGCSSGYLRLGQGLDESGPQQLHGMLMVITARFHRPTKKRLTTTGGQTTSST